ncbi:MAG: DUF819 family protein [Marinilabiliaceae bacterium]|nr:DUF819 family protein [Marinilabiliaceae bacterium]
MIKTISVILLCIGVPLFVMWLGYVSRFFRKVGGIILTYIIGCTLALTGVMPSDPEVKKLLSDIATVAIPLAIPLMLFSSDIKAWRKLTPDFSKSFLCGVIGCMLSVAIGFYIYGQNEPETFSKVGGMLVGLYTGGNANFASIKQALGLPDTTFVLVSAYDILASALYVCFVILAGKRVFGLFMRDFPYEKNPSVSNEKGEIQSVASHDEELFYGIFKRNNMRNLFRTMFLTFLIIVISGALAYWLTQSFVPKDMFSAIFILGISILSVVASLNKEVRATPRTFETGTFFILVFSMAVSSQMSPGSLDSLSGDLFAFTMFVTAGSLLIHILLSTMFRVDVDTTLTTSISLICSPPFVPVISGVLHNRAVVGPGIAVGLIGYAVGTYLGIIMAWILTVMS